MVAVVENPGVDQANIANLYDIDLRRIWNVVVRDWLLIVAIVASMLALGVVVTLLSTPQYKATASVQVEQQSGRVLESQTLEPVQGAQDTDRFLQTQLEVMESRSLALAVARDLKLIGNANFLTQMGVNPDIEPMGGLSLADSQREVVLQVLQSNLDVNLPLDSRIFSLSFKAPDARLAAQVANSFANNYMKQNLQRKYDMSAYAREFLSGQLDDARQRLERSERDAIQYARSARIIDTGSETTKAGGSTNRSLTTAMLVQINDEYSQAIATRVKAEQKWRQATGDNVFSLPEVLSNQAVQNLLQQRATIEGQYKDQRVTRTDEYPSVRKTAAQLTQINADLRSLATSIRNSLRSDYEVALQQEQAFSAKLNSLKVDSLAEQDRSVQLSILRRSVDTNRGLYDALLQRYREISAEAGIQPNNISIIDLADVPSRPVSPNLLINLALAGIIGLVIGLLLAFVRDHLNEFVRVPEDLAGKVGLPVMGAVPMFNPDNVMEYLDDPKSEVSEAFSSIRAALLLSSTGGLPKSMLVTSTQPSEGKSTCSYALARGVGKIGKRVLLLDLDMRRPSQHKLVQTDNVNGSSNLLAGAITLDQAIKKTDLQNVDFISSGPIPPSPVELLSGDRLTALLDELAQRYDIVIIDGPPVLGLADAVILGAAVESTLLVVESGRNHVRGARTGVSRLQAGGVHFVGAILTKYDVRKSGYGYDYSYSYRYSN